MLKTLDNNQWRVGEGCYQPSPTQPIDEFLHWVYGEQQAHKVQGTAGWGGPGGAASMSAVVSRMMALGVTVDCSGSAGQDRGLLHPDAEVAHEAVMELEPHDAAFIIMHAIGLTRPGDEAPMVRVAARRGANGKPIIMHADINAKGKAINPYCAIRLIGGSSLDSVYESDRARWRRLMELMCLRLNGAVSRHLQPPENFA